MLSQLSYTPISEAVDSRLRFPILKIHLRTFKIEQELSFSEPSGSKTSGIEPNSWLGSILLRKEVIQPHLPIRLPCYDFTPVTNPTFGSALLTVRLLTSGVTDSHGVTGGVYKARERIHRGMLIRDY